MGMGRRVQVVLRGAMAVGDVFVGQGVLFFVRLDELAKG
jgi:hypothetical protein